ncbi:hypothetical protein CEB3_c17690 [Peptococcaceae bacterium CEB3]|nr:hypothetical protein CEB3_c17690 [Peptococcaceae bacterium CEB3]
MSLGISAPDVLNYLGQVFTAIWPILAIGLGIMAAPMVIGAAKSAFGRRG